MNSACVHANVRARSGLIVNKESYITEHKDLGINIHPLVGADTHSC